MCTKNLYDHIIAFGETDITARCLAHYGLCVSEQELPFDLLMCPFESCADCLLNNFVDFFSPERFFRITEEENIWYNGQRYYDPKYKIDFVRELQKNVPFAMGCAHAMDGYIPKIERMRDIVQSGGRILFVSICERNLSARLICEKAKQLRNHFRNPNIDFLVIEVGVRTFFCRRRYVPMSGVTKYHMKKTNRITSCQSKDFEHIFHQIKLRRPRQS